MKLGVYIKERLAVIFGTAFVIVMIYLMGYVFFVPRPYMTAITFLLLVLSVGILAAEYIKKRRFYNEFTDILNGLDQKYLITEMMLAPSFQEGKFMMEVLYEINKSMKDRLNEMEVSVMDFKEYLELWIHEIKVPISALGLMNYNGNMDAAKQKAQIQRLSFYVEQILFYARADALEKDYLLNRCNLETTINRVVMEQKELLIGNRIAVEKEGTDITVITDSKWLSFMLGQIVNNSIKYVDTGKTERRYIKFTAYESDREIVLCIEDNGIGISEKDLPRVFDKTFTGENGRKGKASTGMGLHICKKLCDKLGHRIWAESAEGEFTRIQIAFGKDTFYTL